MPFVVDCSPFSACPERHSALLTYRDDRMRCAAEGRFAHPDNHKAYVDCVPDVEGNVLQAHVGSCMDGVFHPDLKKCLPAGKVRICSDTKTKGIFTGIVFLTFRRPSIHVGKAVLGALGISRGKFQNRSGSLTILLNNELKKALIRTRLISFSPFGIS